MRARKPKRRQYCRRCGYELTQLVAGTENFHCPECGSLAEPARMGMTSNFWWVRPFTRSVCIGLAPLLISLVFGYWIKNPYFLMLGVLNPFVAIVAAIIFCPGDVPGKAMYGRCLPLCGYVATANVIVSVFVVYAWAIVMACLR